MSTSHKVTRISTASYGMASGQSVRDRKHVVVHTGCTLPQSKACNLRENSIVTARRQDRQCSLMLTSFCTACKNNNNNNYEYDQTIHQWQCFITEKNILAFYLGQNIVLMQLEYKAFFIDVQSLGYKVQVVLIDDSPLSQSAKNA